MVTTELKEQTLQGFGTMPLGSSEAHTFKYFVAKNVEIWQSDDILAKRLGLAWLREHENTLVNFRGLWVAIGPTGIVMSAHSLGDLHKNMITNHVRGAFVHRVPENTPNKWRYFIG